MRGVLILEVRAGLFHLGLAVLGGITQLAKCMRVNLNLWLRELSLCFFLNSDVDQEDGNYLTVLEICTAVSEVVGGGKKAVDGAHRIGGGGLWRVYLKNKLDRAMLLSSGISLRGLHISLKDKNPFLIAGRVGWNQHVCMLETYPYLLTMMKLQMN